MKSPGTLSVVAGVVLLVWLCPQAVDAQANPTRSTSPSITTYAGRWDLTIKTPARERPSWIELTEHEGRLDGLIVGFGGHATPTGEIQIKNGGIEFSPPEDAGLPAGTLFKGGLVEDELAGVATLRNGASWEWNGRRAPVLVGASPPRWGAPVRLLDGKDLAGWTFVGSRPAGIWKVEDGTLVKHGRGPDIVTTSKFRDFKLHVEFNCGPMANSGVYLRGRYELQIETDSADDDPPNRRMGAVYGFLAPQPALPRTPNVWQSFDITLVGRAITVVHDGRTVIDRREIPGITGGALDSNEAAPGPIYLQGTEGGTVAFRNIVITPAQ